MKDVRIIFMGTPEFAVEALKKLIEQNFNIVGVITAPDKPAGRGNKIQQSAVKKYATEQKLNILQPTNLKCPDFVKELKLLKADLQIVVAFRLLPYSIWSLPPLGTFNLHASLLPQYRGAAPINWAIINGENETGVTTFFLNNNIDTGKIILSRKINIKNNETAGELHNRLMLIGSQLVVETTKKIIDGDIQCINQKELIKNNIPLKNAPKLNKEFCKIKWDNKCEDIYNLIRGLSPYPTAFTQIQTTKKLKLNLKIFDSQYELSDAENKISSFKTDEKTFFKVKCQNGWLFLLEIQLENKKRMKITDFLRGFHVKNISSIE